MRTRALVLAGAMLATTAAGAPIIQESYTQFVTAKNSAIEQIVIRAGLNAEGTYWARRVAAYWMHIGPCQGDTGLVPDMDIQSTSVVSNPFPLTNYSGAVLQIVAILSIDGLGREPSEFTCTFAQEVAAGH